MFDNVTKNSTQSATPVFPIKVYSLSADNKKTQIHNRRPLLVVFPVGG